MKARVVLVLALLLLAAGTLFNQWRLQSSQVQLQVAEQQLAATQAELAQLEARLKQLETAAARRPRPTRVATIQTRETGGLAPPAAMEPTARASDGKRSWGPEQATGEPDTFGDGDYSTAWASREQDGGEEWLKLEYEKAVEIAEVRVRETYHPGAVSKVTALKTDGTEITLWEGTEAAAEAPVEMSFNVEGNVTAKSLKVYLDTKRVPGWNEIDAVELVGRDGSRQWAQSATASSTFANPRF